ncbi:MAG: hypothetical protein AAB353_03990 [Candidatus Hydrogenedentota bacterium]
MSRRAKRGLKVFVALAVLFGVYRMLLEFELARRLDAIRAAGYPVTVEELETWRGWPAPDDENAAIYFMAAAETLHDPGTVDVSTLPIVGNADFRPYATVSSEEAAEIRTYMISNARALELCREGAKFPKVIYPLDQETTDAVSLRNLRVLTRFLRLAIVDAAIARDATVAGERLELALRASGSLKNEPGAIPILYGLADFQLLRNEFTFTLNSLPLDADSLRRIEQTLNDCDWPKAAQMFAAGEFVNSFAYGRALRLMENQTNPNDWKAVVLYEEVPLLGWAYHNARRAAGAFTFHEFNIARRSLPFLNAAQMPLRASAVRIRELENSRDQEDAFDDGAPIYLGNNTSIVMSMLLPRSALVRAMRGACIVERFRRAHERAPETRDELGAELLADWPVDPYDDQPMRYERVEGAYRVYSVGEDLDVDGTIDYDMRHGKGDIGVEIAVK